MAVMTDRPRNTPRMLPRVLTEARRLDRDFCLQFGIGIEILPIASDTKPLFQQIQRLQSTTRAQVVIEQVTEQWPILTLIRREYFEFFIR